MPRPVLEVADIFRDHGAAWRDANRGHVSLGQLKVMSAIERCRTAALGGHVAAARTGVNRKLFGCRDGTIKRRDLIDHNADRIIEHPRAVGAVTCNHPRLRPAINADFSPN